MVFTIYSPKPLPPSEPEDVADLDDDGPADLSDDDGEECSGDLVKLARTGDALAPAAFALIALSIVTAFALLTSRRKMQHAAHRQVHRRRR